MKVLFSIPDIRLFWSLDPRFSEQFRAGTISTFVPYSKYPHCWKDVSFWLPKEVCVQWMLYFIFDWVVGRQGLHQNDVFEVIRDVAGDLVEKVHLFDEFVNKKTG